VMIYVLDYLLELVVWLDVLFVELMVLEVFEICWVFMWIVYEIFE